MKNQDFFNHYTEQLAQFNDLWHQDKHEDALSIADDCLKLLCCDTDAENLSADLRQAVQLIEQTRSSLNDLQKQFSELSDILSRLADLSGQKNAQLIDTLSGWLNNIRGTQN